MNLIYRLLSIVSLAAIMIFSPLLSKADASTNIEATSKYSYSAGAGLSIGGVVPLPFPVEIRDIESFNLSTPFFIEGSVLYRCKPNLGVSLGIRFEGKGMETKAKVKNYKMEMVQGDDVMSGYWTGMVSTEASSWLVSLPVLVNYSIDNWMFKAGPYFSLALNNKFQGAAFDGYLRDKTPIGVKTEILAENPALYDFSDKIHLFNVGVQIGVERTIFKKFSLGANVVVDANDFFQNSFSVITFNMHRIYANIGLYYRF